jgi:iron complex outermembrane recepter protein
LNQLAYSPDAPSRDWTEELQLLSPRAGSVTWAAGLFYFHNENGAAPLIKWFGGPSAPLPTSTVYWVDRATEVTNSIAPFGQLSWKFLTDNELTLGVRYTEEKRRFDGSLTTTARSGVVKDAPYASSVFLEKTTYRVALTHNFAADTLAYASVNSGVKSGGFNVFNPPNPGYQPEKITAYEAGFKSELLNRTLRLNASGFYYDYTNIQVNQLIGGSAFILNGPGASIYGTDIDIEAQVMHGLRFTSGIELLHANFTDYHNAVVGKPNPAGGVLQVTGDATGNRLPLAQNYAVTTALDYTVDGSYGTIHATAGADFNGDYFFEADNFLRQKAYINVNASLDWTPSSGRYTVTLFSRNMLNNAVLTQANTTGLGYLALYEFPPRTYGASLLVKF